MYKDPELHQWWSQWKYLTLSDITLQAMDSQTCDHYALFFLKARAQGQTYQKFLGRWSSDNLVLNDHKVVEDLKRVIKRESQDNGCPKPSKRPRAIKGWAKSVRGNERPINGRSSKCYVGYIATHAGGLRSSSGITHA